jgi:hypothetical protein
LSFTNFSLTNGVTYYYVVSAQNPAGESTNSSQVGVMVGSLSRAGWVASASSTESGGSPAKAIDGNIATRWSTGATQTSGQWFEIDMGLTNTFYGLVLDAGSSSSDYPRGYQVRVSNDGNNWGNPVASGVGTSAVTMIVFSTQMTRFVRVTQTGSVSGLWWSIHEFYVVGAMGTPPAAPTGLAASSGDGRVALTWNPCVNAAGYNVKRSTASNETYSVVATNLDVPGFASTGLTNGATYYFVVSALNAAGESADSAPVSAQPVSMSPPLLTFKSSAGQVQVAWPQDHVGWTLQMQTNLLGSGLGTNWVALPASRSTNQISFPIAPWSGCVFLRLACP